MNVTDQGETEIPLGIDAKRFLIDFLRLGGSDLDLIVGSKDVIGSDAFGRKLLCGSSGIRSGLSGTVRRRLSSAT
ncbi:MAG TPA: hypothetical protein VGL72_19510 [Bryobacteraceae bacterium]